MVDVQQGCLQPLTQPTLAFVLNSHHTCALPDVLSCARFHSLERCFDLLPQPCKLCYWLTTIKRDGGYAGAMGVRTAHQVDPKAQLVVTTSGQHDDDMGDLGEESEVLDAMRLGNSAEPNELKGLSGESDVLSAPRIVDGYGAAVQGSLGGLEQAVLLCWAQQVKKGTSADELQVGVLDAALCACNVCA